MDGEELNLKKTAGGVTGADGFIDRSKVRILLCDNDSKSSEEAFNLLVRCSYQVTPVRSARQVIDALNAEGPDIDIILAEVDLPMKKGMKMLKYITRDKDLRRIPVIMMSAQDEVSVVVKCLRLGAADYLVKPLRTNELLNLWTHMWRRRRMLGLAEKSMLSYDFDVVVSDPSDANTNSTTLFSDDTDDKSWRSTNPEVGISMYQEDESSAAIAAAATASTSAAAAAAVSASAFVPSPFDPLEYLPNVPGISDRRTGQLSSGPKKSELKIGESSAFFTYVKSSTVKMNPQGVSNIEDNAFRNTRMEERLTVCGQQETIDNQLRENGEAWESYSQGDDFQSSSRIHDFLSMDRSCTPPTREFRQGIFREENPPHVLMHERDEPQRDASSLSMQSVYPYFMPGVMNQVVIPASSHLYQNNLQEQQNHANSGMVPQYNHHMQCPPHMAGMASFPYFPVSVCLQSGQVSATQSWPSFGGSFSPDVKQSKVDRREAALIKFRQKRKERCFDKKIRYVNRKKLAERRPRVRGQFVRKVNGMVVDLNGQPAPADSDEDEEEEDEHASRDSSHEDEP